MPGTQKLSSYTVHSQRSSTPSEGMEALTLHSIAGKHWIQYQVGSQHRFLKKSTSGTGLYSLAQSKPRSPPCSPEMFKANVLTSQGSALFPCWGLEHWPSVSPPEPSPSTAHGTQPRGSQTERAAGETWLCFNVISSGYLTQNTEVISGSRVRYRVFLI